jgi:serine/threonine-protein kinase
VIRTDPAAGELLAKGSAVELVVSSGPSSVTVPSVLDLSEADAKATLTEAGFKVAVVQRTTLDPEAAGTVLAQSPEGDTGADAGSTVTIYVGKLIAGTTTTSSSTTTTTAPPG